MNSDSRDCSGRGSLHDIYILVFYDLHMTLTARISTCLCSVTFIWPWQPGYLHACVLCLWPSDDLGLTSSLGREIGILRVCGDLETLFRLWPRVCTWPCDELGWETGVVVWSKQFTDICTRSWLCKHVHTVVYESRDCSVNVNIQCVS